MSGETHKYMSHVDLLCAFNFRFLRIAGIIFAFPLSSFAGGFLGWCHGDGFGGR